MLPFIASLSVGDIYGGKYEQFGLDQDLIASSFGKIKTNKEKVSNADISRSFLTLLGVNVSQISYLWANSANVDKVVLVGTTIECLEFMQMVQMTINYVSGEKIKTLFSDYSSYINLIGMFDYYIDKADFTFKVMRNIDRKGTMTEFD